MSETIISEKHKPDTFFIGLIDIDPEKPPGLPYFSDIELTQMHRYCLRYRDLVRGGGTPTKQQDELFMQFQRICYMEGVAHGQ